MEITEANGGLDLEEIIKAAREAATTRSKDWILKQIRGAGSSEKETEEVLGDINATNAAESEVTPPETKKRQRNTSRGAKKGDKKDTGEPAESATPGPSKKAKTSNGFERGFKIPSTLVSHNKIPKNLRSASEYPEVVKEKIKKEIELGRVEGPLHTAPCELIISPLGVVPKKEAGKFRLIHHLSYPEGGSVNDGIDPAHCAVGYASVDDAVDLLRATGRGALMAKADIEAAFRLLPVHPESYHLLGFNFEGKTYFDKALPMGCSISCAYFEKFSTLLEWALHKQHPRGGKLHYLDDFLFIGKPNGQECQELLDTFQTLAASLGVPLAEDK
ncbi:hypothetical protein NDU88_003940 [Pleurodeles waltl]|uniref:ribonuclease H n=1 Tax=Pleurodeles waltl TaxID=8319 RepID=A0AAV7NHZ4_PLEWA|nr:hypothetical protein NDU88_003940 [Pleurodeles waltl]